MNLTEQMNLHEYMCFDHAETTNNPNLHPSIKLQDLVRLAELCIEVVQENNEHYAEVSVLLSALSALSPLSLSPLARLVLVRAVRRCSFVVIVPLVSCFVGRRDVST